ncbi:MAG: histidine phosphatase family protein [Deltaproteobacteria bacterium]|nr:histidine phosphatase family protein [Deltaproteobacteria bacterium]MBW2417937.1 histidine phosphatase family protein [Deltaproteobacteria bacterium]
MAIYLIRHGETASNAQRRLQLPETPLSERGLEQAERLAGRLRDAGISRIASSDLRRAASTAGAIAATTDAAVELEPLLRERDFGELRGRLYSDVVDSGLGDIFSPDLVPPGGESWEAFRTRVAEAWVWVSGRARALEQGGGGHLAVVTHGLFYRVVLGEHVAGHPGEGHGEEGSGKPLRIGNTALSVIGAAPPHRAALVACVAHLDEG